MINNINAASESPLILIVDDNEAGRYATTRILQKGNFRVIGAASGAEALAQMSQHPDLVVLDVNLPDMSGLEICRAIKDNPATASIIVIQLSATAIEVNDRVRGLDNGADVYLVQPLEAVEIIATVRAMLRLREAERAQRELAVNLDRARAEAELLNLVGVAASGKETLDSILAAAMNYLKDYIPFTGGSIALVQDDDLVIQVANGPFATSALGQHVSRAQGGRSWQVIETGEPFWSNALQEENGKPTTPIQSYIAAPLIWRDVVIGLFELDSTLPNAFNDSNMRLLQKAALVLSGSVEMTRLYMDLQQSNTHLEAQIHNRTLELEQSREQLRQLNARLQAVREAERAHLSREIHDQLGGSLTGLKMDIAMLRKNSPDKSEEMKAQFEALSGAIDNNIKLVRQIASDLRPSLLDDFGLVAAIEWELHEFEKRSGLTCKFTANREQIDLHPDVMTTVFRICQEALTNIVRHAQATVVTIKLEEQTGYLLFEVHDNGRGISKGELSDFKSLGLMGMRERVRLLQGELDISGQPKTGTTVSVKIPIVPQPIPAE